MIENPPAITQEMQMKAIQSLHLPAVQDFINKANTDYLYWSDLKYKNRPDNVSAGEAWAAVKFSRLMLGSFAWGKYGIQLHITNRMQQLCHFFDMNFGGSWGNSAIIPNDNREQYLITSLIEEAISSSQMEGAATTRKVAKDMLRKSITPRNRSERMIYNNYLAIKFLVEHKDDELTSELLLKIHLLMTQKTMSDEKDSGRFRHDEDDVVVEHTITHEVVHTPPPASDIPDFINALCQFANSKEEIPGTFVHPILKAIYIHFMVSYMHPFVNGNGRTARALFYWYMLRSGYWMTEYLSISRIIYRSKASYEKAFLQVEADDNDIGYFVNYHLRVLELAFKELKQYIERKILQKQRSLDFMTLGNINERQASILSSFRDDPKITYTIKELESRFSVSHTTAKTDIDGLVTSGFVKPIAVNKVKSIYVKGDKFDELLE